MLIRLEWKEKGYWVECTQSEAETSVFPRLDTELIDKSHQAAHDYRNEILERYGLDINLRYCFLISKDLESIEPFSPMYPYHPMWNAYSPFEPCKDIHGIKSLDDVPGLE